MRLLSGGSEVLTEKKEEQSSNTSTGRSCSPLCPAGGHICWFLGLQIINLSAKKPENGLEPTEANSHTHTHAHIYLVKLTSRNSDVCTCSHTHPALHNKWFHFNCCSCLFTSACNGWSFFCWAANHSEAELPSKSGTITCNLTFLFIRSKHRPRTRQFITINCLSVLGSVCIYLCTYLRLSWSSFTMPLMTDDNVFSDW